MSMYSIEPGQRLRMEAGERSGFVEVLSEACRACRLLDLP